MKVKVKLRGPSLPTTLLIASYKVKLSDIFKLPNEKLSSILAMLKLY